jgi:hypothetical protein
VDGSIFTVLPVMDGSGRRFKKMLAYIIIDRNGIYFIRKTGIFALVKMLEKVK